MNRTVKGDVESLQMWIKEGPWLVLPTPPPDVDYAKIEARVLELYARDIQLARQLEWESLFWLAVGGFDADTA